MKKTRFFVACTALLLMISACERPQAPDFKVDQKIQAPLTIETAYPFLGNSGALIDTTSDGFDSLFTVENSGFVRLSKEENFDFGDLNDALPQVAVDPDNVVSEIGGITLKKLSSSPAIGTASFTNITGQPAKQKGDHITAGSTPGAVPVDLNTDYFRSATIKDGSLELTFTNNLGFDISNLDITLNSGSTSVGSTSISLFGNGQTKSGSIPIPAGTQLSDLNVEISAGWGTQNMQEDAGNFVVKDITGKNLVASRATAAIESQNFNSKGVTDVDDSEFKFEDSGHFIELNSGRLSIDINNKIDAAIESLDISFPDIRKKSDNSQLILKLPKISSRGDGGQFSDSFDISGYRIFAEQNEITYHVDAKTENAQQCPCPDFSSIKENDALHIAVDFGTLDIKRAKGIILPRNVLLNDDAPRNGVNKLDLFNDEEAEIIEIGGLSELSEKVTGIRFANPALNKMYETDLTSNAMVYAAIAGINNRGNIVYLTGDKDEKFYVPPSDVPSELQANGRQLEANQLIKYPISPSSDGSVIKGLVKFDTARTNASEFFSNLPSDIRFIGIARVNDDAGEESISTPITFDPRMGVDLPLNLSSNNGSFTDTLDANLSSLPGEGEDQQLSQATFTIDYTNNLPFALNLSLIMVDENGHEVTRYPLNSQKVLVAEAASVDPSTGFVEKNGSKSGKLQLSLSDAQLKMLHKTDSLVLKINFDTTQQREVKVRAEDSVTLRMKMSVDVTSTVN